MSPSRLLTFRLLIKERKISSYPCFGKRRHFPALNTHLFCRSCSPSDVHRIWRLPSSLLEKEAHIIMGQPINWFWGSRLEGRKTFCIDRNAGLEITTESRKYCLAPSWFLVGHIREEMSANLTEGSNLWQLLWHFSFV